MTAVYLAIGSNVGDSKAFIAEAIELLQDKLSKVVAAPIYKSKAVGYTDQPDFYNTAVYAETRLKPQALLALTKSIEHSIGRSKTFRWGPREIDIDIIFYGDLVLNEPDLQIPHPRFSQRDFVLAPLCDLNADFIDPKTKLSIRDVYKRLPEASYSLYRAGE